MSQPKAPRNELEAYMANPAAHPKKPEPNEPPDTFVRDLILSVGALFLVAALAGAWVGAKCPGAVDLCK